MQSEVIKRDLGIQTYVRTYIFCPRLSISHHSRDNILLMHWSAFSFQSLHYLGLQLSESRGNLLCKDSPRDIHRLNITNISCNLNFLLFF